MCGGQGKLSVALNGDTARTPYGTARRQRRFIYLRVNLIYSIRKFPHFDFFEASWMSVQDKRVVVNNVAAMDPLERYNNPYVSRVPLDIHATTEKVKFSPMCFVLRCLLPALLVEVSYSREVWIIP